MNIKLSLKKLINWKVIILKTLHILMALYIGQEISYQMLNMSFCSNNNDIIW
jgi:hypothetical protein